jgi:hypothetical protein
VPSVPLEAATKPAAWYVDIGDPLLVRPSAGSRPNSAIILASRTASATSRCWGPKRCRTSRAPSMDLGLADDDKTTGCSSDGPGGHHRTCRVGFSRLTKARSGLRKPRGPVAMISHHPQTQTFRTRTIQPDLVPAQQLPDSHMLMPKSLEKRGLCLTRAATRGQWCC